MACTTVDSPQLDMCRNAYQVFKVVSRIIKKEFGDFLHCKTAEFIRLKLLKVLLSGYCSGSIQ